MAPAIVLGRLDETLDLALGQVLTGPIGSIGLAHRQGNCAFYVARTDYFQVPNGRHFPPLHAIYCAYLTLFTNSLKRAYRAFFPRPHPRVSHRRLDLSVPRLLD